MPSKQLLSRTRSIIRIPTFLAAAGLRRLVIFEDAVDWNSLAMEFRRLAPSGRPTATSRGLITYHPWYQGFDAEAVHKCLSEAASLGTTFLRSDVRWSDVIPDGQNVNENAFAWYVAYFDAVRNGYGMEPMIVLSNPPKKVRGFTANALRIAWNSYLRQVVDRFGQTCHSYQVLNELNNWVYRIFPRGEIGSVVSSAAEVIHGQIPTARVIVNILAGVYDWRKDTEVLLGECVAAIDIVGLDYFPGTWAVADPSDWSGVEDFIRCLSDNPREGFSDAREVAILETGYACNIPFLRSAQEQANYFRNWKAIIPRLETNCGSKKLAYVGIYELCDGSSSAWLDPESHFGLLDSRTLGRKPAFDEVRQLFASLA